LLVSYTLLTSVLVMYIPAVPTTPLNKAYIERQRETFAKGLTPPDFPKADPEINYTGIGRPEDITNATGRAAMGLPIHVA
jgi:Protein of unknown function (DUF1479)